MLRDSLRDTVHADVIRYSGSYSRARLLRAVLLERTFRVVLTLRLCQAAKATGSKPLTPFT